MSCRWSLKIGHCLRLLVRYWWRGSHTFSEHHVLHTASISCRWTSRWFVGSSRLSRQPSPSPSWFTITHRSWLWWFLWGRDIEFRCIWFVTNYIVLDSLLERKACLCYMFVRVEWKEGGNTRVDTKMEPCGGFGDELEVLAASREDCEGYQSLYKACFGSWIMRGIPRWVCFIIWWWLPRNISGRQIQQMTRST